MSMNQPRSQQHGFTLMELMIAIMISGLVFLGVFTVVRAGINTQMFVREMSDAGRQGPAILNQIAADLENAYFYNIVENNFFDGRMVDIGDGNRADQLHFITCRPSLLDDEDISLDEPHKAMLTEVSWILKDSGNGFYELHRREQPMIDDRQYSGGYFRMISDRVVSFRVQYTGWKFTEDEGAGGLGNMANNLGGGTDNTPEPAETDEGLEEEALEWDDDWSSEENGCLPVAVKIELVVSPDIDEDVMDRMRRAGREEELDRSYMHIVLLPQFREDIGNMQLTSSWDGTVAEPFQQGGAGPGAGGPGGRGGGGADGRGGNNRGGNKRGGNNRGNNPNGTRPNNNTSNPFLNIIRGGGSGGGNSGSNVLRGLGGGN